jgi:MFS family permease
VPPNVARGKDTVTGLRVTTGNWRRSRDRRFNYLWAGQAVSQLGDYLPYVSLPLFVKYLTDGTLEVALAYALDATPAVLVGFLGGALIDRWRLRGVMVTTDLLRAAAFGYLAWIAASEPAAGSGDGLGAVLAVAFVAGTLAAFFNGALFAAVPRLVARDRLAVANSKLASTLNLGTILGPALAGVLIAGFGFWATFAINAATFLISAVSLAFVGEIERDSSPSERSSYIAESLQGLSHLWSDRRLRVATIGVAGVNFVTGFMEGTLVLTFDLVGAKEEWQQGLLFTFMGAGALVGSMLAPRVIGKVGNGRTLVVGTIVFGLLFAVFTRTQYGVWAFLTLAAGFIGFQLVAVPYVTIRQKYTPDHLLGRVATVSRAIAWTTLPVGALIGAALSDLTDFAMVVSAAPFLIAAIGVSLTTTVVWRETP